MYFCINCGEDLENDEKFCRFCGYKLESDEKETSILEKKQPEKRMNKKLWAIIPIVIIILSIVLISQSSLFTAIIKSSNQYGLFLPAIPLPSEQSKIFLQNNGYELKDFSGYYVQMGDNFGPSKWDIEQGKSYHFVPYGDPFLERTYILERMENDTNSHIIWVISQLINIEYKKSSKTDNFEVEAYIGDESKNLFNWDKIPGDDSGRLIEVIVNSIGLSHETDWLTTATIEKINDGMDIRVFNGNKSLSLELNSEKTKVNMQFEYSSYNFIVKMENNQPNIYDVKYNKIVHASGVPSNSIQFNYPGKQYNGYEGEQIYNNATELSNITAITAIGYAVKQIYINATELSTITEADIIRKIAKQTPQQSPQ